LLSGDVSILLVAIGSLYKPRAPGWREGENRFMRRSFPQRKRTFRRRQGTADGVVAFGSVYTDGFFTDRKVEADGVL
jgi:hypothetical protein